MIAALGGLGTAFLVLLWQVQTQGWLVTLDGRVNAGLAPLRRPLLVSGFAWLTQAGTGGAGAAVALVASGLLWSGGRGGLVGPLWLVFLGAEATTWSMKFVLARTRPPFLEGITVASPSFPSAHATVALALYGFLALAIAGGVPPPQRVAVLAAGGALVLLLGFSRLLLSVHYLTDVLAGFIVAAAWVIVGWRLGAR